MSIIGFYPKMEQYMYLDQYQIDFFLLPLHKLLSFKNMIVKEGDE